jgi:hypothetical protein
MANYWHYYNYGWDIDCEFGEEGESKKGVMSPGHLLEANNAITLIASSFIEIKFRLFNCRYDSLLALPAVLQPIEYF